MEHPLATTQLYTPWRCLDNSMATRRRESFLLEQDIPLSLQLLPKTSPLPPDLKWQKISYINSMLALLITGQDIPSEIKKTTTSELKLSQVLIHSKILQQLLKTSKTPELTCGMSSKNQSRIFWDKSLIKSMDQSQLHRNNDTTYQEKI